MIDISDPANPEEVGFIPTHQDTLVGEGTQVVHVTTAYFTGDCQLAASQPATWGAVP